MVLTHDKVAIIYTAGWTPSRLGGGSRTGARHTVARRLNVDQALKGAGPLGSGLAPLIVPQNLPSGDVNRAPRILLRSHVILLIGSV